MKSKGAKAASVRKPVARRQTAKPAAKKVAVKVAKPKMTAAKRPTPKAPARNVARKVAPPRSAKPAKAVAKLAPGKRAAAKLQSSRIAATKEAAAKQAATRPALKPVAYPKQASPVAAKPAKPAKLEKPDAVVAPATPSVSLMPTVPATPVPATPVPATPVPATPVAASPVPAAPAGLPAGAYPTPPEARPAVAREVSPAFASLVPGPIAGASVIRPPFLSGSRPGTMPGRPHGPMTRPQPVTVSQPTKGEPVEFAQGDHVVYPTHGVGKVMGIVNEEIAGHKLQLIVVTFDENRMTLRVPVAKARSSGLRKLASRKMIDTALTTLKGRARIKRTMWSRRAQEYEAKINSGDPIAIAEVVRDLHRNAGQPDQSFSERQIYEAALDRLASEIAAIDGTDKVAASEKLAGVLKAA
jgi:CarD family transcriptional regulator